MWQWGLRLTIFTSLPPPPFPPPPNTHNQRWVVGMSRHTSCAPSSSEQLSGLRSGRWGQCASSTASPFVWLLTAPLCCTHINRASHQSCWTSGCAGSFVLAMSSLCCTFRRAPPPHTQLPVHYPFSHPQVFLPPHHHNSSCLLRCLSTQPKTYVHIWHTCAHTHTDSHTVQIKSISSQISSNWSTIPNKLQV